MRHFAPTNCTKLARAALVWGVGAASCGSAPSATPGDPSALSSCSSETRAIQYMPNLSQPSASGAFTAILVKSDPGPPIKGTNTWTLKIVDSTGAPQDGLAITTLANMPDHNHPPSVVALVTGKGGGLYEATPVYLFMAGFWEVTFSWVPSGGAKESVVFPICISS